MPRAKGIKGWQQKKARFYKGIERARDTGESTPALVAGHEAVHSVAVIMQTHMPQWPGKRRHRSGHSQRAGVAEKEGKEEGTWKGQRKKGAQNGDRSSDRRIHRRGQKFS
ncbi:hypothetical protein niasHT_035523 [Heterodera trifolii]|uniref:Uncharacterized protein n=1 Tax=Heterodera trifolii TaxID=157864 RepID=A0ABD2IF31_9BILA